MNCSLSGSSVHGNSPGKTTGVGCHALLQGIVPTQGLNPHLPHCRLIYSVKPPGKPYTHMCCAVLKLVSHVQLFSTPQTVATKLISPWAQSRAGILEWVASALLQGIFPMQGSSPGLSHCRQILYLLSHWGYT